VVADNEIPVVEIFDEDDISRRYKLLSVKTAGDMAYLLAENLDSVPDEDGNILIFKCPNVNLNQDALSSDDFTHLERIDETDEDLAFSLFEEEFDHFGIEY